MRYFTKEVKIGITGIIALCILVFGINYLKGINLFKPAKYFYVKYENINGLPKSSPVFADGYKVGIVREIYYDYQQPGKVAVEIELDTDLRLPVGSSAELSTDLLGSMRMNLLLANNPRQSYSVGDTIPGVLNNGLMENVATLMPQVERLVPKLDSIMTSLNMLLNDPNIPATLHSVRVTAQNLETTTRGLNSLIKNDIPLLTGRLNTISENFVTISDNLKGIDYQSTFREVDATLANVRLLTEKLNNKQGTAGLLLNDPELYNNLTTTMENAATLLDDLKANPRRYVHFSLFGRKQN